MKAALTQAEIQRVQTSFAAQGMMQTLGAELAEIAPGAISISAPISDGVRQQQGYPHGGLAFAIGDSAAGYAALSLVPLDREVLTVEMKINYLAAVRANRLVARGRVVKPGRTISVVAADVYAIADDGGETHIAALQGTMISVAA